MIPVLLLVWLTSELVGAKAPAEGTYEAAWYTAFVGAALPEELCKIGVFIKRMARTALRLDDADHARLGR